MTVLKLFRKVAPVPGKSAIPLCPYELAAGALDHAFRITCHADPLRRVFHNQSARMWAQAPETPSSPATNIRNGCPDSMHVSLRG